MDASAVKVHAERLVKPPMESSVSQSAGAASSSRSARRRKAPSQQLNAESQAAAVAETDAALLQHLVARLGLEPPAFLARGQRGVVFVASYAGGASRDVAVKLARTKKRPRDGAAPDESRAAEREAAWLKRCNGFGVGPALLAVEGSAVAMAFAEGDTIGGALEKATAGDRGALATALADLLGQCRALDERGIDKKEMGRCARHVVVRDGRCVLLDFERCAESAKPQNVTGVAQYLSQSWASAQLARAGIAVDVAGVRAASKAYKDARSEEAFLALERALGLRRGGGDEDPPRERTGS